MSPLNKQRLLLFLALLGVGLVTTASSLFILYQYDFKNWQGNIQHNAKDLASFTEAVARFDRKFSQEFPGGSRAATLSQVKEASSQFSFLYETGEVLIVEEVNGRIEVLLRRGGETPSTGPPAEFLARVMKGESGVKVERDATGNRVMVAYEPLPTLKAGLVLKINMEELQAPYWRTAFWSSVPLIILVVGGVWVFARLSQSQLTRLQSYNQALQTEIEKRKLAEETQERSLAVLEAAPEIIGMANEDGRIIYLNPAGRTLLGYGLDEDLSGAHIQDFHPEEEAERIFKEGLQKARREGSWEHQAVFKGKDGRLIQTFQVILAHKGGEGQPVFYSTIARDLTEERRIERLIRESELRMQTILDSLPVRVFWKDLELNYMGCNKAFVEDSGWDHPRQLIHKSDYDMQWKDNAEVFRKDDLEVIQTGKSKLDFEEKLPRGNGTFLWLKTSKVPLKNLNGKVIGVLGVFLDITREKEAVEQLKTSEQRMEQVIQSTGGWVWEISPEGRYTYSNSAVETILGYRPDEIIGKKHCYDLFPPEDREETKRQALEAIHHKIALANYVNTAVHKDGHHVTLSTCATPLLDESGNLKGYRGVDVDISEHQDMLNALRENEARYRSIFEGESDAFFLLNRESKVIEDVNRSAIDLFGYSREEFLAMKMTELSAEPEESRQAIEGLVPGEYLRIGSRLYKKKDGSVFPVEISAGCFEVGTETIVFGALRDISQRMKTEEQMLILSRAIEQSPVSIMITNATGDIEYVNPHFVKLTGYSREESKRVNPRFLKSGHHSTQFYEDLWKTIKSGKTWAGEFQNRKKNGELFWVSSVISPIMIGNQITHFIGVMRDVTQEKEAEARLEALQKQLLTSQKLAAIGQLSAGVSHEVLNPVNIISLHMQLLARKRKDEPELVELCNKVIHEVGRIQKIMGALLTFSRQGAAQKDPVVIKELLDGVVDLIQADFALDNIHIKRDCSEEDLAILGDRDKLRQVFLNLVNNAKYAMPNGGEFFIRCRPLEKENSHWVQVSVEDTGTGIKKEHLEKLFLPFFTTKPEGEGTGMGLAMVHGIIEEHGGTIRVESQEGQGTKFIIEIPRA